MADTPKPVYHINPPTECDICGSTIGDVFIDGRTRRGPWANMDPQCHIECGFGLGTGRGQRYERQANGCFLKVAG